jgi:hypothetical protein
MTTYTHSCRLPKLRYEEPRLQGPAECETCGETVYPDYVDGADWTISHRTQNDKL